MNADLNANGYSINNIHYLYLGDPSINGTWRIYVGLSGNLTFEERVSGSWVFKGGVNQ
jgi:hypothetical protein